MPGGKQPNLARGAKCKANLKKGGSPGRPKLTPEEKAAKKEAQKLARNLLDKKYFSNLRERLVSGKVQPGVEVAVWHYAFGKPKEEMDVKLPVPVRITHEYSE